MQFQGKISNWNDDKGFGFVEPNGGGERAFVHIKAFNPRTRRPINGDVIIYDLLQDKDKRYRAENIRFARDSRQKNKPQASKKNRSFGGVLILLFSIGLVISVLTGKLPLAIPLVYLVMSVITFIAYAIDKSAAENGRWRTQENTLHLLALVGGWPGAILGQMLLRHKSKKKAFRMVFWLTVILNVAGLFWLHTSSGSVFLQSLGV
ncbi:DNA-binding protein [Methylophaga marina]|uniref:Cold shock and DUF1294 domain-containing protein n=1 Tax=Methylophaga marina TaxID=45495 RepID=A0ABP3D6Z1_9GAMM|nr:cold shock and DUF1294 domain-containing protein [Methylophaga marina]BDZ74734.1 DNA-binding protein [Methylophaga marina]